MAELRSRIECWIGSRSRSESPRGKANRGDEQHFENITRGLVNTDQGALSKHPSQVLHSNGLDIGVLLVVTIVVEVSELDVRRPAPGCVKEDALHRWHITLRGPKPMIPKRNYLENETQAATAGATAYQKIHDRSMHTRRCCKKLLSGLTEKKPQTASK